MNRGTLPLHDKWGKRIDVMQQLRRTSAREQVQQRRAFVHVGSRKVPGRLCWVRIPEDKVAQARQRAQRETEGVCDDDTLFAAEFVVVFTTILHELNAQQILMLYRARWQVELDFKRSKSIRELDRLPNFLPETIHSLICAKLLLQLIAVRIASPAAAGFPPGELGTKILPAPSPAQTQQGRSSNRPAVVRSPARLERRVRGSVASASCRHP